MSLFGIKALSKLLQKKYREEYGLFLVEGKKGVFDALHAKSQVEQLVMTDQFAHNESQFLHDIFVSRMIDEQKVLRVSSEAFQSLSDAVTPQGVLAVVKIPQTPLVMLQDAQLVAILEDIRDPGNLGTMIRTADWFGVDGVLLVGGADPYQPKVVRSSMGSLFHVPLILSRDITNEITELKKQGFSVIVTRPELAEEGSEQHISTQQKRCIIFGNEAHGTSRQIDELADQSLSIPKYGAAESLNVAVSFGIVLNDLRKA